MRILILGLVTLISMAGAWYVASEQQKSHAQCWLSRHINPRWFGCPASTQDRGPHNVSERIVLVRNRQTRPHAIPKPCKDYGAGEITREHKVFKWHDAKGKVHYGDKPPPTSASNQVKQISLDYTDNYNLDIEIERGTLPPFTLDRVRYGVDTIYKTLSEVIRADSLKQVNLKILFYTDASRYHAYRRRVAPTTSAKTIGFHSSPSNQIVVLAKGNTDQVVATTLHEATHAIVAALYSGMPVWLNEGLAKFFETMVENGEGKKIFRVNDSAVDKLRKTALPRLHQYLRTPDDQWYNRQVIDRNYAMSWSVVFYLMKHGQSIRMVRELLGKINHQGCQGVDTAAYIDKHYPGGINSLERNWRHWLASVKPGTIFWR